MKRFYTLWLYAVALTAVTAASVQSTLEEKRLVSEASSRTSDLAGSLEESIGPNYRAKRFDQIARTAEKLRANRQLLGITLCPAGEAGRGFPRGAGWESICKNPAVHAGPDSSWIASQASRRVQYFVHTLDMSTRSGAPVMLVIAQDMSYLRAHWLESFFRTFLLTFAGGIALMFLIAMQIRGWLRSNFQLLHQSLRSVIAGRRPPVLPEKLAQTMERETPELGPISRDIHKLAAKIISLSTTRAEQGELVGLRARETAWLQELRESMGSRKLVVVANREPYIHQRLKDRIEVIRPASGLVTALEPILRKCGGLWIAHGSGSADAETVDANSEVAVPPGHPSYTLKRVWLTREEELGYYYGFANEGMWPLCHLAHNRPTFRLSDWQQYVAVNRKFCDSIRPDALDENSLVLVQDYHFALLPRMARERALSLSRSGRTPKIGIFWHIPWPNPEAFGICPWSENLLRGMLGADVIGFHTQYHCNNFLETCNRFLEARIDQERFTVTMENHETFIRPFPIGIDTSPVRHLSRAEIDELKRKYGIKAELVAVGVDRLDYTKGLLERVEAVERFLEKNPAFVGRFSLVQMGSPSRTHIPAYRMLGEQLEQAVKRVNDRFGDKNDPSGYQPIVLLASHHEWDEIQYFYQIGDLCMVTSLHDGMNLVAKEYVWCQAPERAGALILSQFTGASRELTEAFIVNPYSIEEMADAIHAALTLPAIERVHRMKAMRDKVQGHNAYHWASDLIQALIKKDEISAPRQQGPDQSDRLRLAKAF